MKKTFWTDEAKDNLKKVYLFNRDYFSLAFAKKINAEILFQTKNVIFSKQWQSDDIHPDAIRRIIVRHWKITYEIIDDEHIAILNIFDTRQDPSKCTQK